MLNEKITPQHDAATEVAGTATEPWSTPVFTVHSVNDVTRAGTTSSRNDGFTVFSPTS